jgi:hypothetical protein
MTEVRDFVAALAMVRKGKHEKKIPMTMPMTIKA